MSVIQEILLNNKDLKSKYIENYQSLNILVVDDEIGTKSVLEKELVKYFSKVDYKSTISEVKKSTLKNHYDVIILDLKLLSGSFNDWLEVIDESNQFSDIILMTGTSELEQFVKLYKINTTELIFKPIDVEHVIFSIQRCYNKRLSLNFNHALSFDVNRPSYIDIIGNSQKTRVLKQSIKQFAASRASILIEGEVGIGKELVARSVHFSSGRIGPFVPINCGSMSQEILEVELFGHTEAVLVGAKKKQEGICRIANNGTLFLDNIDAMPLDIQSSIMHMLEQRTIRPVGSDKNISVDIRVVAATKSNLQEKVEAGKFHIDLYHRLNVLKIHVPPLRERKTDLIDLVPFLIKTLAEDMSMPEPKLSHEDILAIHDYDWPGNIRELRNLIEYYILLGKPSVNYWGGLARDYSKSLQPNISVTVSPDSILSNTPDYRSDEILGYPNEWSLKEVEKRHIQQVVSFFDGNKSAASRQLGIVRKTLDRKYKEWKLNDT